jgi:hypothetical protein
MGDTFYIADYFSLGWGTYDVDPRIFWGGQHVSDADIQFELDNAARLSTHFTSRVHYRSSGTLIAQQFALPVDQNRSHLQIPFTAPADPRNFAWVRQIPDIAPAGTLFTYAELAAMGHQYWQFRPIPSSQVSPLNWPSDSNFANFRIVVTDAWSPGRVISGPAWPPLTEQISESLAGSILNSLAGLGTFGFIRHQATADYLTTHYGCPDFFASTDFAVPFAADTMYLVFRLQLPFPFNRVFTAAAIAELPHQWLLLSLEP